MAHFLRTGVLFLGGALLGMGSPAAIAAEDPTVEEGALLFVRRVAPVIREKCVACHGADPAKVEGGFRMLSRTQLLEGGESGRPAVVPGKPLESPLYIAITGESEDLRMPPKQADRLDAVKQRWIERWIAAGAPWPDEATAKAIGTAHAAEWAAEDGVTVETSGGLTAEWSGRRYDPDALWAYRPVKKPPAPRGDAGQAVDDFLLALVPKGTPMALRADRRTLIRRATFDLTGLPPTPEEIRSFEGDRSPDQAAFGRVVERLLASPHYGERMARHWLDVVRYADSSGFANDYERGNAWRYRDYVVRAFNADKPFDRFIREQIAGDELDPADSELLVATGFLRMGPWELTAMEVPRIARQRFLDDVTNSVGETFLAHSLQCARCHDHKFDPVPTRDYYAIQAVFATTQQAERPAAFLPQENTAGFEGRRFLEARRREYRATLSALDERLLANADRWFADRGVDATAWNAAVAAVRASGLGPGGEKAESSRIFERSREALAEKGLREGDYPPRSVGFTPEDYGRDRVARKGLERLRWEWDRYEPIALAVYSGRTREVKSVNAPVRIPARRLEEGEIEATCVLTGGDPFSPGARVTPGVLSVLGEVPDPRIPESIEGRRKAFAEWVANPANPLTTRAIVNRVWLWHFGQAIAGNPNNFGSTGKRPTHPDLLDWLAATFVERGWSVKALHRTIMASEAYCRSGGLPAETSAAQRESAMACYAVFKPRRLTAEELRDAMLAVSGELNLTVGGIPNRPEIDPEVALQPRQVMGTFAHAWVPDPLPEQRHRRSLYTLKIRGLRDPFLEVFNEPAPDFSCEAREASTVTPQVFTLFNGQATYARALALARRALSDAKGDDQAVARCFELALGRPPAPGDSVAALSHWRAMEARHRSITPDPTRPPLEVRRDAVDENTGERFSFRETLEGAEEFVPDVQFSDADPRTRGLAELCLVLFNSNAFVFVD